MSATFAISVWALLIALLVAAVQSVATVRVDDNEPPLLKPEVPLVGHILNFVRRPSDYFISLRQKHNVEIATLQLGLSKVYVVWAPGAIQSVFRSKVLSHDQYSLDFARHFFNLSDRTIAALRSPEAVTKQIQQRLLGAIHEGLRGDSLKSASSSTLRYLSNEVNAICVGGQELEVPNLYIWLRDHITVAVSNTLYGVNDPFQKDPSLVQALWDFEGNFVPLLTGRIFGRLLSSSAFHGRKKVQSELIKFYRAGYDQNDEVAPFIRTRAELLRQAGVPVDEVGRMEASFMFVAITGSGPITFSFLANIVQRPELLGKIRLELERLVSKQEGVFKLRASSINDSSCPLLVSCWNETLRLGMQFLGTRHALEDITVSTGDGRSYLLKKGVPIIWTAKSMHFSPEIWGENATEFEGDRFITLKGSEKQQKNASFFPFGGGQHLCPGRHFAYNEIICFTAALMLGFDIENMNPKSIEMRPTRLGEAVMKPLWEGRYSGCTIKKRPGWDELSWQLEV
ncbi:hypothetical protein AC578_6802 [Pseudocercospora eumusae]|uniref:Cytochrome P450 n=1 Tax=Pseudocercospora eumusae TaxID=321146 RepID=A0A139GUS0_9PEZI|nr:hypothetical protein AC578_6802 [Pseudocercospora eumusae]